MAEIKEMAEKIRQAERGETPDDAAGRAKAAKEKQERRGIADEICKRIGNRTFEYTNRPCIIGAGSVAGEMESSHIIEKIISFCDSGKNPSFCRLFPSPVPKSPPAPIAYSPCKT